MTRVAFAGSPAAAVTVLRALVDAGRDVALVVSQPDKPRGRGGRTVPTPVSEEAERLGLNLVRPKSINEDGVLDELRALDVGALCVVGFGQILREPLLSDWPCINVHFSILPAYRGAAPVERALMDGVTATGVTIMRMDPGLDTGPIIATRGIDVAEEEDAGSLLDRLARLGGELLIETLEHVDAGTLSPSAQPDEGISLAPKITDADLALDFTRPARALANQVRALSPHIGATAMIDGQRFKVWKARAIDAPVEASTLAVDAGRLLAGSGEGALEIQEIQPPGRSRMDVAAFMRGWRGGLSLGADG